MIRVGDIFEIQIAHRRFVYGQYVHKSELGPMVVIYDMFFDEPIVDVNLLKNSKLLFPPVLTGLNAAIKSRLWKRVGRIDVLDYSDTKFISAWWDDKTGKVHHWSLWDGKQFVRIGSLLPDEYKNLEFCIVWDPQNLMKRIISKEVPYPYKDMIKYGNYDPKNN